MEDTKNEVYMKCPRKSHVKTTPGGNPIYVQNIACNITSVWLKSPKISTRSEANHTPGGRFHWLIGWSFRKGCVWGRRDDTDVISHMTPGV